MSVYFVAGANGSGKTYTLKDLQEMLGESMSVYDFDDIGVLKNADKKWRQEATEKWIQNLLAKARMLVCLDKLF